LNHANNPFSALSEMPTSRLTKTKPVMAEAFLSVAGGSKLSAESTIEK